MTAPIPEDKLNEIKAELLRGRKIEAIKLYRRSTGAGLAEAKAAVERLETGSGATSPQNSGAAPAAARRGCLGAVLVIGVVLVVIAAWLTAY